MEQLYQNDDYIVTGNPPRPVKVISPKPSHAVKATPSLDDYLARGELKEDFENDGRGGKVKLPPWTLDWTLHGLEVVVAKIAKETKLRRSAVQRLASKLGLILVPTLPGWTVLEKGYWDKVSQLDVLIDPDGIRFLESADALLLPKKRSKKHGVSIYAWVGEKIQDVSMVLGLPKVAMVNILQVLAISTLPRWGQYYAPDIQVLISHIRSRQVLMDAEQTDQVWPDWLKLKP